jgi:hypothetical protein
MKIDAIDNERPLSTRERGLAAWRALIESQPAAKPLERATPTAATANVIVAALPAPVLALQRHSMSPSAGQLLLAARAVQDDGMDLVSPSREPSAGSASSPSDASALPGQTAAALTSGDVHDGQAGDLLGSRVFDTLVRRR